MRILLAGATGVLGRGVIPLLVQQCHEVTAVGRSAGKRDLLVSLGAKPIVIDLFDPDQVRRAVKGSEVIINLSTAVPPGFKALLPWAWKDMDRVRREISSHLARAALQEDSVQRMIQESFAPVYPDSGDDWVDETTAATPARYNRSSLDAEANLRRFTDGGGAGVVLRFAFLYGPNDQSTQTLIDSVRRGWYPLFGRRDGYTSWLHHADAATAVAASLDLPAGIYNVVEDLPMRRIELADGLAREVKVGPPKFLPAWVGSVVGSVGQTLARSIRISNRKLKNAVAWAPRYPRMLDGLQEILGSRS